MHATESLLNFLYFLLFGYLDIWKKYFEVAFDAFSLMTVLKLLSEIENWMTRVLQKGMEF